MIRVLWFRSRQKVRRVSLPALRRVSGALLDLLAVEGYALGVCLVSSREIIRLNEAYLHHAGSTDVITFDYSEGRGHGIAGEIFICVDEALLQARRFGTTWQAEVLRYLVHGILHLLGFDDGRPTDRRLMKQREDALLQRLCRGSSASRLLQPRARSPRRRSRPE